jgi:3-hydroxybutyryl-CoA dehydrogenase
MKQAADKIVVIGTGTMAVGIGAGFIDAGFEVVFLGRTIEKANKVLADAHALALKLSNAADPAHVQGAAGLIDAWSDWTRTLWVIETVAEDFELKRALFTDLDKRVPAHIPIGSNSSGFPITKIAEGLTTQSRMFNAHYFMPAHLVPLVEVALGVASDAALGEQVCELYRRAGKKPVLVRKDIPGFLANRIQHALMREAMALIALQLWLSLRRRRPCAAKRNFGLGQHGDGGSGDLSVALHDYRAGRLRQSQYRRRQNGYEGGRGLYQVVKG